MPWPNGTARPRRPSPNMNTARTAAVMTAAIADARTVKNVPVAKTNVRAAAVAAPIAIAGARTAKNVPAVKISVRAAVMPAVNAAAKMMKNAPAITVPAVPIQGEPAWHANSIRAADPAPTEDDITCRKEGISDTTIL